MDATYPDLEPIDPERLASLLMQLASMDSTTSLSSLQADKLIIEVALSLLMPLGVIKREQPAATIHPSEVRYRLTSDSASIFLRSLAQYIRHNEVAFTGWARAVPDPESASDALNGPAITLAMETKRNSWHNPEPTRETVVAQAIIKARLGWQLGERFLVRWDDHAHAYQLVGGHKRPSDSTAQEAMLREIAEEIPGFLTSPSIDIVAEKTNTNVMQVSRTHGALTEYEMHFFAAQFARTNPTLSRSDRWVTRSEIIRARVGSGKGHHINIVGLKDAVPNLDAFLSQMPPSFPSPLRPPLRLLVLTVGKWIAGIGGGLGTLFGVAQGVSWLCSKLA